MKKIGLILVALLTVSIAFSQYRVKDKSTKRAPSWVNGLKDDYLIASASAPTVEGAKELALLRVKEKITNAVAVKLQSSSSFFQSEEMSGDLSSIYEKFESVTKTQSAKRDFLKGISESKIADYYWELKEHKKTKVREYEYHILYPFSVFELNDLVAEFEKKEQELTDLMNEAIAKLDDFSTIEEIKESEQKLQKLKALFSDERLAHCDVGIAKAKSLLESVYLADMGSSLGEVRYAIFVGDKQVTSSARPKVSSNCVSFLNRSIGKSVNVITYDFDGCYDEPGNKVTVRYRFGNNSVSKDFVFSISENKVDLVVAGPVILKTGGDELSVVVPVLSKTDASCEITKVQLELPGNKMFDVALDFRIEKKGQIEVSAGPEAITLSEEEKQNLKLVNGYLYFMNHKTGVQGKIRMYKQTAIIREN